MIANRAKLLIPLGTMAVAAAVTVASGADWSSSSISTTQVTGGILSQENGDLALSVTGIKPGDLLTGTVTITNNGNMPAKLSLEETAHTTAFSPSSDLTLTVKRDGTTVWAGTFGSWTGATEVDPSFTVNEVATFTFVVGLNANASPLQQGKTAGASYTFTTTQLAADTTGIFS